MRSPPRSVSRHARPRARSIRSTASGDADNDLVVVNGEAARALGTVTHLTGRILDATGGTDQGRGGRDLAVRRQRPLSPSVRHSWLARRKRDPGFQGRGRMLAGADGGYSFRTIRPVAYPGRTPHIHFAVSAPGRERLITQMYVAGEPQNERDGISRPFATRPGAGGDRRLEPADRLEEGALAGRFDIVLGG